MSEIDDKNEMTQKIISLEADNNWLKKEYEHLRLKVDRLLELSATYQVHLDFHKECLQRLHDEKQMKS